MAVISGIILALLDKPKEDWMAKMVTNGLHDDKDEPELSKALEKLEVGNRVK